MIHASDELEDLIDQIEQMSEEGEKEVNTNKENNMDVELMDDIELYETCEEAQQQATHEITQKITDLSNKMLKARQDCLGAKIDAKASDIKDKIIEQYRQHFSMVAESISIVAGHIDEMNQQKEETLLRIESLAGSLKAYQDSFNTYTDDISLTKEEKELAASLNLDNKAYLKQKLKDKRNNPRRQGR